MSDFTKTKIGFAIAFLATLFTIPPLIDKFGTNGFAFFGFHLEIQHLYYGLSLLFTISVYFYAIQFLTERKLSFIQFLADSLYAVAIVLPPIYFLLYVLSPVFLYIGNAIKEPSFSALFGIAINILASFIFAIFSSAIKSLLTRKEKRSVVEQLGKAQVSFLDRAKELFNSGYYDLSVFEAYKAIEASARSALLEKGITLKGNSSLRIVEAAEETGLIPTNLMQAVHFIRNQRNRAAHANGPVSKDDAAEVLMASERILAALTVAAQTQEQTNNALKERKEDASSKPA